MIEFEEPKPISQQSFVLKTVAENMMRPVSRYFDEHEHEIPWDYINFMHMAMRATGAGSLAPKEAPKKDAEGKERPRIGYQMLAFMLEMLSWGDVGIYLCTPGGGLGLPLSNQMVLQSKMRNSWHDLVKKNPPLVQWQ